MYLLVKGINGFGNMISVLNCAYCLAKKTKRTLVIDWTHSEWVHGFDKYFIIKNIKYKSYDEFIKEVINKKNLEIYPKIFQNRLTEKITDIYPEIDKQNNYNELFDNCIKFAEKKRYDIIVFTYNWLGYNGIKMLWDNLELKEEYKNELTEKINKLGIYKAIHIRHTDITNMKLDWVIDFINNNKDINIYVATDNEDLLEQIKKLHSNIYNYTTFYDKNKPLHTSIRSLEEKERINKDTIIDMYILSKAQELKITPIKTHPFMTTFSLLAMAIRV